MTKITAETLITKLTAVKPHERILLWPGEVGNYWSACQCEAKDWQHCRCPVRLTGTPLMVESPRAFRVTSRVIGN